MRSSSGRLPHASWWAGVAAVLLVPAASSGCTCMGCPGEFSWRGVLSGTPTDAEVDALRVTTCHNGRCSDSAFVASQRLTSGQVEISVSRSVAVVADGDRWSVEVRDPAGTLVAGLPEQAVHYTTRPNNTLFDYCTSVLLEGNAVDAAVADSGP